MRTDNGNILDKITPASDNDHSPKVSSGEKFVEMDPTGIGMAIIAMSVVFSALALLYVIYKSLAGSLHVNPKSKKEGEGQLPKNQVTIFRAK
jgi:hypothetical protein